mmetsp:Transcript_22252/g.71935  ORF Transcript_22252/g.71935 Transcript_22252/m.71935 type:complete len:237 (-) Transcript_22252:200-910(-)
MRGRWRSTWPSCATPSRSPSPWAARSCCRDGPATATVSGRAQMTSSTLGVCTLARRTATLCRLAARWTTCCPRSRGSARSWLTATPSSWTSPSFARQERCATSAWSSVPEGPAPVPRPARCSWAPRPTRRARRWRRWPTCLCCGCRTRAGCSAQSMTRTRSTPWPRGCSACPAGAQSASSRASRSWPSGCPPTRSSGGRSGGSPSACRSGHSQSSSAGPARSTRCNGERCQRHACN